MDDIRSFPKRADGIDIQTRIRKRVEAAAISGSKDIVVIIMQKKLRKRLEAATSDSEGMKESRE
jgi:hypothetical protein